MFIFDKISRNITCNSAIYIHFTHLHFMKQAIYVLEIFSLMLTSRNRLYMCWYSPHVRDF